MMPINAQIPLGVNPLQIQQQDPNAGLNSLARMMQISGAMDEQKMNALKMDEYKRGLSEQEGLRTDLAAPGADPYNVLLRRGKVKEAGDFRKSENEAKNADASRMKTELETGMKKAEHVSSVLSLAKDPQSYAVVRAVIKNQFGQDLPEQFDPRMIEAEVAKGQTYTQRLQAEHQRLTLAETTRHNTTTETETGRHNRGTEGIQYSQLTEAKRHNGVVEQHGAQTVAQGAIEYKQDAQGNWIALPKKVGPGPIQSQAVNGPGGQPLPTKNEIGAKNALGIITEAEKLLDGATGSYMGAGVDLAGRVFGQSTKGADTIAQLKALEGALMMAQPRMEGPQSDKDVALYRQMAAQIGDPTIPNDMKKAALQQVKALHQRYAQPPAANTGGATGAWGGGMPPANAIDAELARRAGKKP